MSAAKKRTRNPPDAFQRARQIYNARFRLFEKAAQLIRDADPHTRALVEAQEEADAQQTIEQSPDLTPRDGGPLPTDD